jgi:TRAP-type mannitol/chloroaromatic compound transport system permease small subunit
MRATAFFCFVIGFGWPPVAGCLRRGQRLPDAGNIEETARQAGRGMNGLLRLSGAIDRISYAFGWIAAWLVLLSCLISAGNAMSRYLFSLSSNAWLEIQWYLFAAIFLLCSGYTLLRNEHVRIDVISGRFSRRGLAKIDIFGFTCFLLPMTLVILYLSVPLFANSVTKAATGEIAPSFGAVIAGLFDPSGWEESDQAGGLVRWPVKLLIPAGFVLLGLQGLSELVKRFAFLRGLIPDPNEKAAAHGSN